MLGVIHNKIPQCSQKLANKSTSHYICAVAVISIFEAQVSAQYAVQIFSSPSPEISQILKKLICSIILFTHFRPCCSFLCRQIDIYIVYYRTYIVYQHYLTFCLLTISVVDNGIRGRIKTSDIKHQNMSQACEAANQSRKGAGSLSHS